jgi:hypothetical protein
MHWITEMLLKQADEIAALNIPGWGNTMRTAAERIQLLESFLIDCDNVAILRGDPYGVCDAIDNGAKAYKSADLENVLRWVRSVPSNNAVHLTPAADALSATDDMEPQAQVTADR